MTEQRGAAFGMDPTELWRQWYETGTKAWSGMTRATGDNPMDPYGVYGKWIDGLRDLQESMGGAMPTSGDGASVQNLWQRWYEMTADGLQKGTEISQNAIEVLPRWMQMLEQARDNLLSVGTPAADPLQFATQWYNATSGPFSEFVGDLIEREEFLEPSSQFLQSYAGFYKIFKRNSEEYLKNLQLPARSDVSRVAGLVVSLEDKVDNIEELLEDLSDSTAATAAIEAPEAASPASVKALESRLDSVESKLDRVLAALENAPRNGGAPVAQADVGSNGAVTGEAPAAAAPESGRYGRSPAES